MIATKINLEYFRSEEKLFAFVDKILKKNALYNIEMDGRWFVLSYWYDLMYQVLDSDHKLVLRLGTHHYGRDVRLYFDDVLVLDGIAINRSWFYYPALLVGQKERYITHARGYTPVGNVFNLVRVGVLKQISQPKPWAYDNSIYR